MFLFKKNLRGFVDPITLVGLTIFLVVTVVGGIAVSNNKNKINTNKRAAIVCMDPCRYNSDCDVNEYCYIPASGCAVCKVNVIPPTVKPPTSTPKPTLPPVPESCGGEWEPCCTPNKKCDAGYYCSTIDGGTCLIQPTSKPPTSTPVLPTSAPTKTKTPTPVLTKTPTPASTGPCIPACTGTLTCQFIPGLNQWKCNIAPTITKTPTPTPSCSGTCIYGPSSCDLANKFTAPGTCTYPGICCGAAITVNNCTQGTTYCVNSNTVAVCKVDKSGYTNATCATGTTCDSVEKKCILKLTPTPTILIASCSTLGGCYLNSYICEKSYGQLDCGSLKKCGVHCSVAPTPTTSLPLCASPNQCMSLTLCANNGTSVTGYSCTTAGNVCCKTTKAPTPTTSPCSPPCTGSLTCQYLSQYGEYICARPVPTAILTTTLRLPTPTTTSVAGKPCYTGKGWFGSCTVSSSCDRILPGIAWDNNVSTCKSSIETGYGCCGKMDLNLPGYEGDKKCLRGIPEKAQQWTSGSWVTIQTCKTNEVCDQITFTCKNPSAPTPTGPVVLRKRGETCNGDKDCESNNCSTIGPVIRGSVGSLGAPPVSTTPICWQSDAEMQALYNLQAKAVLIADALVLSFVPGVGPVIASVSTGVSGYNTIIDCTNYRSEKAIGIDQALIDKLSQQCTIGIVSTTFGVFSSGASVVSAFAPALTTGQQLIVTTVGTVGAVGRFGTSGYMTYETCFVDPDTGKCFVNALGTVTSAVSAGVGIVKITNLSNQIDYNQQILDNRLLAAADPGALPPVIPPPIDPLSPIIETVGRVNTSLRGGLGTNSVLSGLHTPIPEQAAIFNLEGDFQTADELDSGFCAANDLMCQLMFGGSPFR